MKRATIILILLLLYSCQSYEFDNLSESAIIVYDYASSDKYEQAIQNYQKLKCKFLRLPDSLACTHVSLVINLDDKYLQITTNPRDTIIIKEFIAGERKRYYQYINVKDVRMIYNKAVAIQSKGIKYDYVGAINTIVKVLPSNDENKLFCSEFVALLLDCEYSHKMDMLDLYLWAKKIEK